jgi:hypothetical protein
MKIEHIAASIPATKSAALVTGKGTPNYIDDRIKAEKHVYYSDIMPEIKRFPGPKDNDLSGAVFGRLEVVGYYGSNGKGRWVCRCTCGKYVIRTSTALKKFKSPECDYCHKLDYIRGNQ